MNPVDFLRSRYRALQNVKSEILDEKRVGRNVEVRPDDVWLVSYPKSGNTWTRFLLANLVYKNMQVGFDNIENLVPDIYQHSNYYLQSFQSKRFLKSHEYFDPRYKKVILIVRDPRDVAVSYYHHLIKFGEWNEDALIDDFIDQFINGCFGPFGSWGENIGSWIGSQCINHDMLILRYEDMLENTADAVKKIGDFLEIEVSDSKADVIVTNCSVEAMQALEREQGANWKPLKNSDEGMMFVRKGKSGEWKAVLTGEQAKAITTSWGVQMKGLGYIK
ncbi:MAG: sulfotransferase domain-containing protein [Mariprofundaceae bacterium]|nr:sulfotransferase domain-containing protein [Mariprofundaceae bacterium]